MTKPSPSPLALPANPAADDAARWTQQRQAEFLRQLVATKSVSQAAAAVGMSRQSAYRLRARLKGQPFDLAWEIAFQHGYYDLAQAALERAMHGVEVPVFHGGELVGTYRKYDERLTCFLLAQRSATARQPPGGSNAPAASWARGWGQMLARVSGSGRFCGNGVTWRLVTNQLISLDLRPDKWVTQRESVTPYAPFPTVPGPPHRLAMGRWRVRSA